MTGGVTGAPIGMEVPTPLVTTIGQDTANVAEGASGAIPPARQVFTRVAARTWWIILTAVIVGGAAGAVQAKSTPAVYQADVVVIASNPTIPAENFGSVATTAFNTDTVLDPVIRQLGLNTTAHRLVGTGALSIEAVSGSTAIRILGRAKTPELAAALANSAAESFVSAATRGGLGTFSRFGAGAPGTRVPAMTGSDVSRGAFAGLLFALLFIIALTAWQRPVFGREDVATELGPDVVLEATSRARRRLRVPGTKRSVEIHPRGTALAVLRALESRVGASVDPCVVLVERRPGLYGGVMALMEDLITAYWASPNGHDGRRPLRWHRSGDAELPQALAGSTAIVALVSEAVSRRQLRRLEDEIRLLPADRLTVAVLVR